MLLERDVIIEKEGILVTGIPYLFASNYYRMNYKFYIRNTDDAAIN